MTADAPPDPDPDLRRLRAWAWVACGSTLVMILASWPLWSEGGPASPAIPPRVPFVPGMPAFPIRVPLAIAVLLAAGPRRPRRGWFLVAACLAIWAIGRDQNRLQPWMGQFLAEAAVIALASPTRAVRLGRWLAVILYVWSGLSKLDAAFVAELGSTFLDAGLTPLGLESARWPIPARTGAILLMPLGEIAVAVGLKNPRTRRIALAGAVGLHLGLLALFGPGGLDQSLNVRAWNGAMILRDLVLFGGTIAAVPVGWGRTWRDRAAAALVGVLAFLPSGESWGVYDLWPSHALYASHGERAVIAIHADDADRFPGAIRRRLGPADLEGWRRLDLTGWSRATLGTPIYPQNRVRVAIAGHLARFPSAQPVRVVEWGRADRWTGVRGRPRVTLGARAMAARVQSWWFGARAEDR